MTVLTNEQIEAAIIGARGDVLDVLDVTKERRIIESALSGALRGCFIAGRDHGEAAVMQRAESLLAPSVADAQAAQVGRSMLAIFAWVGAQEGRLFSGVHELSKPLSADMRYTAGVVRSQQDKVREQADFWSEMTYGSTMAEAISKLASWCTEHSAKRDTLPAAAPSEQVAK